jgi:ribosome biogenesis GTPase
MRELALWDDDGGVDLAFEEIQRLGASCRFGDCAHRTEPGCAVLAAIEQGALDPGRLEAYFKLERELAFAERKRDRGSMSEERKRWKALTMRMRKKRRFEERL